MREIICNGGNAPNTLEPVACAGQERRGIDATVFEEGCELGGKSKNIPQWLKPRFVCCAYGTTEVVPFQNPTFFAAC